MSKVFSLSKIPIYVFFIILLYIPYTYLSLKQGTQGQIEQKWHYYISPKSIQSKGSDSRLKLQHQGQGQYSSIQLQIRTHDNQKIYAVVDKVNHTHIDQTINQHKNNIKHLILKSQHPIMFTSKPLPRRLLTQQTSNNFVSASIALFQVMIPIIHNLIIVGIITNSLDLFFPLIMLTQSLSMLAFLDNQKHYLKDFYYNIFNSKIDIFNLIRLVIFNSDATSTTNQLISAYGFNQNILTNLSGQFIIGLLFLAFTIFLKAGNVFLKYQRLRNISSKLRPMWNGFIFLTMPKCLVFAGFSLRSFDASFQTVFSWIVSITLIVCYILFFIQLIFQVRKINERIEYIDQNRLQIGLAQRIQHKQNFHFDCLNFSNLYYPTMNFARLFLFFISISIIYDFTYASFGGPIVSQLFYVMFNVSSSGYSKNRDKFIYPFCDFLFIIVQLALISVGLAQSVLHSQISVIAEVVYFSVFFIIFMLTFLSLGFDIIQKFTANEKQEQFKSQKQLKKSTKFLQQKTATTHRGTAKTKKTSGIQQDSILSDTDKDDLSESANSFQKPIFAAKAKVRKIRRGKII